MKVLEFRKLSTEDRFDEKYNDGSAWSRPYEYPLVIDWIKKYYKKGDSVHNSSWGFQGIHVKFKEELDKDFSGTLHSDILESELPNTFFYDITKKPKNAEINKYDFVINVSTMEEIKHDHIEIFKNLFLQLKKGGIFITTFDLCFGIRYIFKKKRCLQLRKFESFLKLNIKNHYSPLNGSNSVYKNSKYKHLQCGILVIKK